VRERVRERKRERERGGASAEVIKSLEGTKVKKKVWRAQRCLLDYRHMGKRMQLLRAAAGLSHSHNEPGYQPNTPRGHYESNGPTWHTVHWIDGKRALCMCGLQAGGYLLLALYLDSIVPQEPGGTALPWYFLLMPSFWSSNRVRALLKQGVCASQTGCVRSSRACALGVRAVCVCSNRVFALLKQGV